ncbi:MAG TPA: TcpQ domain-containing protein [Burkholderiales bacterium]|nr:TcpQ domain-containing protein [Burkholderiales bacterium]
MKTKDLFFILFLFLNMVFSYADSIELPIENSKASKVADLQENKDTSWIISSDDRLISKTIEKWINKEGYTLIWDAKVDFQIQTPGVIHGSLEEAVSKLLKSFNNNEYYLQVKWYNEKALLVVKQVNFNKSSPNLIKVQSSKKLNSTLNTNLPSSPKSDMIDSDVLEPKEPPVKPMELKKIPHKMDKKESSSIKIVKVKSAHKFQDNEVVTKKRPVLVKAKKPVHMEINKKESSSIKIVKVKSAHKFQESKLFTSKKTLNSKSVPALKPELIKSKKVITDEDVNASFKKISMQSSLYQKLNMGINYESAKNAKLRILKPVESASTLVKPVKDLNKNTSVIAVSNEKSQTWKIDIDDKVISVTLNKWALREGYTLIWDSKTDFQIQTSGVIRGTFKNAINEVLKSFKDTDNPLKANWYKNKVIKIVSLDAVGLRDK